MDLHCTQLIPGVTLELLENYCKGNGYICMISHLTSKKSSSLSYSPVTFHLASHHQQEKEAENESKCSCKPVNL